MRLLVSFLFGPPQSVLLGLHRGVEPILYLVFQLFSLLCLLGAELGLGDRRTYHVGTAAG